jgi:hypothetical protein
VPGSRDAESIARELIEAFCAADTQRMRSLLAADLRAYITNREGGVDEVGAEEYLQRVAAMDLPSAQLKLVITQAVAPRPEMVMAMVEVNAARGGRTLLCHECPSPESVEEPGNGATGAFIAQAAQQLTSSTHRDALGISPTAWHWQWHVALARELLRHATHEDLTPPRACMGLVLADQHLRIASGLPQ